jgi:hypothetical protein
MTFSINPQSEIPNPQLLRLFVYGTLKRGYWNHQRSRAQARSIEPAVVWGRLYHLHAGFPALEVPEGLILARGTADPMADARRQHENGTPRFGRPTGDWDLIHGDRSPGKRFTGSFSVPAHPSPTRSAIYRPSTGWKASGPAGTACISG